MTSARDTEQIRITRVVKEHHTSSKAHRSLFVWITLMVVLTLCGRSRSYEGQNTGDKSVALRIIAPESSVCSGTSSLKVDIYLTNVSNRVLRVQRSGIDSVHYRVSRPASSGGFGDTGGALDDNLDPWPKEEPTKAITLQPGESYTTSIKLYLHDDFFRPEGFYRVSVHYDGAVHPSVRAQPGEAELFKGRVDSNWLIFEVEKCGTPADSRSSGKELRAPLGYRSPEQF